MSAAEQLAIKAHVKDIPAALRANIFLTADLLDAAEVRLAEAKDDTKQAREDCDSLQDSLNSLIRQARDGNGPLLEGVGVFDVGEDNEDGDCDNDV